MSSAPRGNTLLSDSDRESILATRRVTRGGAVLALALVLAYRSESSATWPIEVVMALLGLGLAVDGFATIRYRLHPAPRPPFHSPRAPRLSRALMWFEWHSIMLEAVWVAILFQCLLGYREGRGEPTPGVVTLLLFGVVALPVARFGLGNGTLRVLKRLVAGPMRIVLLRHFDAVAAGQVKASVAPMLGCYGHLVTLHDPSLEQATSMATSDAAATMSDERGWHPPTDDWKTLVSNELAHADLAVFVLSDRPSQHLAWELGEATACLPADRVLVLCREVGGAPQVHASLRESLARATVILTTPGESALQVGGSLHRHLRRLGLAIVRAEREPDGGMQGRGGPGRSTHG